MRGWLAWAGRKTGEVPLRKQERQGVPSLA